MDKDVAGALVRVIANVGIVLGALTILGGLFILIAGPTVLVAAINFLFGLSGGSLGETSSLIVSVILEMLIVIGILLLISGIFGIIVAANLMKFKEWARISTIVIAALSILQALIMLFSGGIISLIINGVILYLLGFNEDIKKLFITQ